MENFTHNGFKFCAEIEHDGDTDAPWEHEDGHGPVSEWTSRSKNAGELVLCSDRGRHRFYDFAGAVKLARRDGWDTAPYGQGTAGQRAERAARADYERLRAWCNDQWSYVGVIVHRLDHDGEKIEDQAASLWGIESDAGDYLKEVSRELAADILHDHAEELAALAPG